jgi:hypothetical protein
MLGVQADEVESNFQKRLYHYSIEFSSILVVIVALLVSKPGQSTAKGDPNLFHLLPMHRY